MDPVKNAGPSAPRETLSVFDGAAFVIGIVIGIGIFATPSLVAKFAGNEVNFLGVWLVGGALTLIGALCYAELATAFPNAGGEYHYLSRAYGRAVALLFAWARGTVIQTGAIALVAFVYGDYAATIVPLGTHGPAIHAGIAVAAFTGINMVGTLQGKVTQHVFTVLDVTAILMLIVAGIVVATGADAPAPSPAVTAGGDVNYGLLGLAMVFVLLTYGGWNEAAYLSAELRDPQRNMVRTLVVSVGFVVLIYFVVNWAYLSALGLQGLQNTNAAAADAMRKAFGPTGATVLSVFVCGAALSTLNATIFTGARVYYALGRDLPGLRLFGVWDGRRENPANAFLLQGAIALALVVLGAFTRDGFKTMVEYTSPVFWFFMLLIANSLFIFRRREPARARGYRVPLYPLTPLLFIATCAWMLYSSLAYTGVGALVGVAVLAAGTPLLLLDRKAAGASDAAE
jgi:basic amino acid/polyamine antiporter, APA family